MPASLETGDPFDALGDPNRRAIVELLGAGERSVQELADALPISRPAVSRHLRLRGPITPKRIAARVCGADSGPRVSGCVA